MAPLRIADPTVINRFLAAVRVGLPWSWCCRYADISDETWIRYRKHAAKVSQQKNPPEHDPIVEFVDAVARVEAEFVMRHMTTIEREANGAFDDAGNEVRSPNWRAAAYKLEKRYPREFGNQTIEISGPDGGPVQTEMRHLPPLPDATVKKINAR